MNSREGQPVLALAGTFGMVYGLILTYKGFTCSNAQEHVAVARKVYDEIKKAQEKQPAEQITVPVAEKA